MGERVGVDSNHEIFDTAELVASYDLSSGLTPVEEVMAERWIPPGSAILDLGIGTGRTYEALAARASSYIGLDYAPAMVEAARRNHPHGCFKVGDAADLAEFSDGSFDVVVFSYNGMDYLHPFERRRQAMREIHRVLEPGGRLIFSTHNPRAVLVPPPRTDRRPEGSQSGAVLLLGAVRRAGIATIGTLRASLSLVPSGSFWHGSGYEDDRIRSLATFYATPTKVLDEVDRAGFHAVHVMGAEHPNPRRQFVSPWTYVSAVKPKSAGTTIEVHAGIGAAAVVADDWDHLVERSGASVFQSRPWVEAWHGTLQPGADLVVLVARDDESGEAVGLLALAWMRRPLHRHLRWGLRYLGLAGSGPGAGDHLGPIADDDATASVLLRAAVSVAGGRTVYFESVAERWATHMTAVLRARRVGVTPCPASRREAGGSFSDNWSSKFRKNLKRRARRLEQEGVRARWISERSDLPSALETLRALHLNRWQGSGNGLFSVERQSFLSDLVTRSAKSGMVRILVLENDEQAIGALLGLVSGPTFSVYKTGWNPQWARFSPGIALGAEAMRWAEANGLTSFDYLRGTRQHKVDLGCTPVNDVSFVVPEGVTGRMLQWREILASRTASRP